VRKKKKTRKNRIMEPPISLPVEETVAELANSNKPPLNSRLADLSNLNSAELEAFEQAWVRIKPKRQRQIMSRLIELAEDNVELNFESILKNRLKDRDPEVRSRAIEGLWECEETSLISPLVNLLEQDRSEKVQVAAATGLGKFAMLAEHKKLRSRHVSRVYQALLTTIDDKSKPIEVRRRALEAAKAVMPNLESMLFMPWAGTATTPGYLHWLRSWLAMMLRHATKQPGHVVSLRKKRQSSP